MAEPVKHPYTLNFVFASGQAIAAEVGLTTDEAHVLRKAVADKVPNITIGKADHGAAVIDARNLDYFQMTRGITPAHTGAISINPLNR